MKSIVYYNIDLRNGYISLVPLSNDIINTEIITLVFKDSRDDLDTDEFVLGLWQGIHINFKAFQHKIA